MITLKGNSFGGQGQDPRLLEQAKVKPEEFVFALTVLYLLAKAAGDSMTFGPSTIDGRTFTLIVELGE